MSSAVRAQSQEAAAGISRLGVPGIYRVPWAVPPSQDTTTVVLSGSFFRAEKLFEGEATRQRQSQRISVAMSLWPGLGMVFSQEVTGNVSNLDTFYANPQLTLTYGKDTGGGMFAGGAVSWLVPASFEGVGLNPGASVVSAMALGSYSTSPLFGANLALGFVLDRSETLLGTRPSTPVERFEQGISHSNRVLISLGLEGRLPSLDWLKAFSELHAELSPTGHHMAQETVGLRLRLLHALHLSVGADLRLVGAPGTESQVMGLPPWDAFVSLGGQMSLVAPEAGGSAVAQAPATADTNCDEDDDCGEGQRCLEERCVLIREREVVSEVTKTAPTFSVRGVVADEESGEAVGNARVVVSGFDGPELAVSYKTGEFVTWPIPTGEGLLRVAATAPGFEEQSQTVPRAAAGQLVDLNFSLKKLGTTTKGTIKGSVKDSRNGDPIKGSTVFIPVLNLRIKTDPGGAFAEQLAAGRYQIMISAKGYQTQAKEIEIQPGDTLILNVDLKPR